MAFILQPFDDAAIFACSGEIATLGNLIGPFHLGPKEPFLKLLDVHWSISQGKLDGSRIFKPHVIQPYTEYGRLNAIENIRRFC